MTVSAALANRRIFLTGHTGFTGSWLGAWLSAIGCEVTGYSLEPETDPNLFGILGEGATYTRSIIGDIRDYPSLREALEAAQPELVMHLAAQPLVRRSYRDPLETFSSNAMGTANVLEASRGCGSVKAFVCVTTDKVYENVERPEPYSEADRLGGKDPYSASKACAEIITRSYQETLADLGNGMRIATARGGNIIGGGDWSEDRIVPDFYRAATDGTTLSIRNPDSIRPWQHVLSACHGYLAIAAHLLTSDAARNESWNIGPADPEAVTVRQLVDMLSRHSKAPAIDFGSSPLKEANLLALDVGKARRELGFAPPWNTEEVIARTAGWYAAYYADPDAGRAITLDQLRNYRIAIGDIEGGD
ncbi:CDP-glucose 4,6-dehydratase [Sphingomonas daechungensis]|uniref:CDP-glucose 4,6-dehydratase n=1 Tax=Sphingomonas daechungensis TaxID=1176646 RepID=UPI0031EB8ABD